MDPRVADSPDVGASSCPDVSDSAPSLARLLSAASEISGRINAILDPDELLNAVIPMLKEGFGFYYVHVYTLDPEQRMLYLRAGYGVPGREMLARGHRIPVDADQSLVAQAARTHKPVTVNDVTTTPAFLPNSLLPDTRSELALPMIVGEDVLGVFDVQHNRVDAFTQVYQDVLFALSGQIATALQNARHVERIAQSLKETQIRLTIAQALGEAQTERAVIDTVMRHADAPEGVSALLALAEDDLGRVGFRVVGHLPSDGALGRREPDAMLLALCDIPDFVGLLADRGEFSTQCGSDDERLPEAARKLLTAAGVDQLLALPLRNRGQWLGVLLVAARVPFCLDEDLRFRYRMLAEQGVGALYQAQLRDRLSLTQFSVDQAPVAILWIRPDGTLSAANDSACTLLGYTRAELLALPAICRLDPNMIPRVWDAHWEKVRKERRFSILTEYRMKDGTLIPVEVTANYLRYDGKEYNCVFARDVRERLAAQRVAERFTVQLRTAAEIAERIGTILDTDALLATVIPLLKERFGLYHAHVYGLDGDYLVLRAGYGRIGQIMVQQGHRIPLQHPHSLVARAAVTREPVLVDDVSESPDFLPNLLLPKTQSEVAVPIIFGDQVLGVFDVQSDERAHFATADLDVFRTLAGQLANALYSARLFEQQVATQRELQNSVQTVRAVFNAMTEGILVTDMMGRITDLNEAALRLYGYGSRDDLLGRSAMDLVTKSGWARMAESTNQSLISGRGQTQEYTMVRQDGTTFDAEQSSALLWDAAGEPYGVVSITRDITERRRARREILRFRALAENAVDAIVLADFSGRITYANEACLALFGYQQAPHEFLSRSIANFWPDDRVTLLLEEVLPAAGAGGWRGEVTQVRRDASVFEAALTFFAVSGERGEPLGVAAIVRDISERKRAEADLRKFALQLRTAADVSAQVTTILDPTRLLEAVVPLVQERFGLYHVHVYTLDRAQGRDSRRLIMRVGSGEAGRTMRERGHSIGLDQRPSLVAQAARTGEIVRVDDVTSSPAHMFNPLLPKTRSEVAIPMVTGDEVIGVFDVQDARPGRFDASEIEVLATLAGQIAVGLRNAESFEALQQVAERLREVDRLKSEFLANMSHELRTPLNSILGYAELLQMGIDGELSEPVLEDVTAIFENGQQLLQLINDILDLTKIEAGRMALSKLPVSVVSLLEEARSHCMGLLHRQPKPVEIVVDADDGLPLVIADPVRLAQVLNNLLSNAIKFTDRGEIRLHARHDAEAGRVCIDVVDTGIGISPENLARLFERFRQIDGSTTRRAEGTGLGLAISRHLVEMHGGTLTATSEVGRGSMFTVSLPLEQHAAEVVSCVDSVGP